MVQINGGIPLYIIVGIHLFCNIFEISVIIFLLSRFRNRKSIFCSPYFIILCLGYCVDLTFAMCWISGKLTHYSQTNPLLPWILFMQCYAQLNIGFWDSILAFNRCTALAFPLFHRKIWTKKFIFISITILSVFPFIIDFWSFFDLSCKFWYMYETKCFDFQMQRSYLRIGVNFIFGILSLSFITFGILKSPKLPENGNERSKMEKRLIIQSLLSSILLIFTFSAEGIAIYLKSEELIIYGYIFYILEFYPPIFILFYVSAVFRTEYIKFYRLNRFICKS